MLGSIILVLCLAAFAVAAGIVFVLVGPLPVNRRLTLASRIQPLPTAAGPIAMGHMPVFDPAQATFAPPPQQQAQQLPFAMFEPAQAQPVAAVPPPPPARKAKPLPPIAPVQLRRPRTGPAPLPRRRAARGTEQSARTSAFEVEHTAPGGPVFEVDDPTFLEDGH